jgi:hypothetical protein
LGLKLSTLHSAEFLRDSSPIFARRLLGSEAYKQDHRFAQVVGFTFHNPNAI